MRPALGHRLARQVHDGFRVRQGLGRQRRAGGKGRPRHAGGQAGQGLFNIPGQDVDLVSTLQQTLDKPWTQEAARAGDGHLHGEGSEGAGLFRSTPTRRLRTAKKVVSSSGFIRPECR
ncbi:hypothetical protein MVI01_57680 [Myxococcus virescens]|uniref:Uncharacterized protein n=1 Tax=Myxococcus virescens TaxID=83456 RepID=A0A511HKS9_9BACT|nr:hypothetical protein MVI01_57680 [Myxococcus virescens]